jgi:hypothetical protein
MQNGDAAQAASELSQLMQQMSEMAADMNQLEALDEMLDQIAEAKEGMSDGGEGDMASEGMGMGEGDGMEGMPGYGLGRGRGRGDRPEEATDTQFYESRVAGKLQRGKAVVAGSTEGPNLAGVSREEAREAIISSMREQSDPLVDDQLPRDQREHTREYFKRFVPSFEEP